MEPTIYKPSIYKGAGIYKTGAGGGGGGFGVIIGNSGYIDIGGVVHPYIEINDFKIMTLNLDYKYPGLAIGGGVSSTAHAWYYNNNESTYGLNGKKYGLLYNWYAVKEIIENGYIPDGWRVPTRDDLKKIIWLNYFNSYEANACKNVDLWNGNGVLPELNFVPSGNRGTSFNSGVFQLWTSTEYNATYSYAMNVKQDTTDANYDYYKDVGRSVRFISDL